MGKQARRFGASPVAPVVEPRPPRTLLEMARENAIEGCVRETYGAVEAAMQAARADDPHIARVMRAIARDEARHAELAWRVAAWARAHLTAAERAELEDGMREAVAELASEARREVEPVLQSVVGVPLPGQATAAVEALSGLLWARAA